LVNRNLLLKIIKYGIISSYLLSQYCVSKFLVWRGPKEELKLSCDSRFQLAFTARSCVFKEITLVWANQGNFFESATTCSKRLSKTIFATQLKSLILKTVFRCHRPRKSGCGRPRHVVDVLWGRTGVNFINIKRANFSYETSFWQLFSSYMYVKKLRSYEKFVRLMLMKLTTGEDEPDASQARISGGSKRRS